MLTHQAFDKMIKQLGLKAQDICDLAEVSKSRLSQFRNGKGSDIGVKSLDALLDAAQSLDPRARKVYAEFLGGRLKSIEEMTPTEKGELMIALGQSMKNSVTTDQNLLQTA